jgi:hypothetical protein
MASFNLNKAVILKKKENLKVFLGLISDPVYKILNVRQRQLFLRQHKSISNHFPLQLQ